MGIGIALILTGCSFLPQEQEALAPPLIEPAATQYETETLARGDLIDAYEGRAVFTSTKSEDVYYRDLGQRIKEVHIERNQSVEKGDLLIELEQGDLAFQLQQQQINLNEAKLDVESAQERKNDQEKLLSDIEALKKERDKLQEEIKTQKDKLKNTDIENEKEIIDIQNKLTNLEQKKQEIEQDINLTEQQKLSMSDINRDITRTELNVERQQNQLDNYRTMLDATQIIAPISGVITSLADLKVGEMVEPFETLVTISDPASLRLVTNSIGSRGEELSIGMEVTITIDGQELEGEIFDLPDENAPDKDISIEVKEIPSSINLGESAEIRIIFGIREDVINIPQSAVRNYEDQQVVRILDGDNLKEVEVQTGLHVDDRVEIIGGLEEGDQLILR